MICTFNSQLIWGALTHQTGMTPRHRWQEENIPGIAGARIYDLASDGVVWNVEGLIVATGANYALALANCVDFLNSSASYMNAGLYPFRDAGGNIFPNCMLIAYQQASRFRSVDYDGVPACIVNATGSIRWMLPE